jgi:tetratricopeptide (TPR) repeat protein
VKRLLYRSCLAIAAILLAAAPLGAAAKEIDAPPSQRRARLIDYTRRLMVEAYETSPYRDPKWDGPARAALLAMAEVWSEDPRNTGDEENIIMSNSRAAIAAGCSDPMVRFALARAMGKLGGTWTYPQAIEHGNAAGFARKDAHYSPYIRAYMFLMGAWHEHGFGEFVDDPDWENCSKEFLQRCLALLPEVFGDKDLPPELVIELIDNLGGLSKTVQDDRMVLVDRAMKLLEKSPQPKSIALSALGSQMIAYAWDARGVGLAGTVTQQGWKLFQERIDLARQLLEQAWKLDPSSCEAANDMITVMMAGGGKRDEMELWFKRAMSLDPGNWTACSRKMLYLQPKWHGSFEEMLEFGRALAREGNWAGQLPLILEDAHWTIAHYGPAAKWPVPDTSYFKKPGVWADLRPLYEAQLQRTPESRRWRTRYMLAAAWAGQWNVAGEQLEKLNNKPSSRVIGVVVTDVQKQIEARRRK